MLAERISDSPRGSTTREGLTSTGLALLFAVAARGETAHELREVHSEEGLRDRGSLGRGSNDTVGQFRHAGRVDDREVVNVAERCGGFANDRGNERQCLEEDRRLVELAVGLGEQLLRAGLGLAARQDGGALGLAGQLHLLRVRLGREYRGLPRSLGLDDRGAPLGLGRLDRRAEKLFFAPYSFKLGELGLLLDHVFRGRRLSERARLVRFGLRFRG